jgi:hypothetical protein
MSLGNQLQHIIYREGQKSLWSVRANGFIMQEVDILVDIGSLAEKEVIQ